MLKSLRNPKHLRKMKSNNKTENKRSKEKIVTFRKHIKVRKRTLKGSIINIILKAEMALYLGNTYAPTIQKCHS